VNDTAAPAIWPAIPTEAWGDTKQALARKLQVVGKLTLSGSAHQNHWWQIQLPVSPRGLRTPLLRSGSTLFDVEFDFVQHEVIFTSSGASKRVPLREEPLQDFYSAVMGALGELGIDLPMLARPVEVPDPATPFAEEDGFSTYDPAAVSWFWQVIANTERVFDHFGSLFVGKASRPGLFWGGTDFAASRYSGREAPPHPGGMPNVGLWVMREGYSHEVAAHGYFADYGTEGAFYAYCYPEPDSYKEQPMPDGVVWSDEMSEWILPYEVVRTAADPDQRLLEFLQAAYDAAATALDWDPALKRDTPIPGHT